MTFIIRFQKIGGVGLREIDVDGEDLQDAIAAARRQNNLHKNEWKMVSKKRKG